MKKISLATYVRIWPPFPPYLAMCSNKGWRLSTLTSSFVFTLFWLAAAFGCDSFGFTVLFFLIYKGLFSLLYIKQSAKCNVVNCKGNYNEENKCRVFRLPKDEVERQTWINKLPPRK